MTVLAQGIRTLGIEVGILHPRGLRRFAPAAALAAIVSVVPGGW